MSMQYDGDEPVAPTFRTYRPSKAAFVAACVGASLLTMFVGFNWGGWMTIGTARDLATTAANVARGELAGSVCIERFNGAPDADARMAELKAIPSASARRQYVEAGGWATMPGETSPDRRASEACATALAA